MSEYSEPKYPGAPASASLAGPSYPVENPDAREPSLPRSLPLGLSLLLLATSALSLIAILGHLTGLWQMPLLQHFWQSFHILSFYLPALLLAASRALLRPQWLHAFGLLSFGILPLATLNGIFQVLLGVPSHLNLWLDQRISSSVALWLFSALFAIELVLLLHPGFRRFLFSLTKLAFDSFRDSEHYPEEQLAELDAGSQSGLTYRSRPQPPAPPTAPSPPLRQRSGQSCPDPSDGAVTPGEPLAPHMVLGAPEMEPPLHESLEPDDALGATETEKADEADGGLPDFSGLDVYQYEQYDPQNGQDYGQNDETAASHDFEGLKQGLAESGHNDAEGSLAPEPNGEDKARQILEAVENPRFAVGESGENVENPFEFPIEPMEVMEPPETGASVESEVLTAEQAPVLPAVDLPSQPTAEEEAMKQGELRDPGFDILNTNAELPETDSLGPQSADAVNPVQLAFDQANLERPPFFADEQSPSQAVKQVDPAFRSAEQLVALNPQEQYSEYLASRKEAFRQEKILLRIQETEGELIDEDGADEILQHEQALGDWRDDYSRELALEECDADEDGQNDGTEASGQHHVGYETLDTRDETPIAFTEAAESRQVDPEQTQPAGRADYEEQSIVRLQRELQTEALPEFREAQAAEPEGHEDCCDAIRADGADETTTENETANIPDEPITGGLDHTDETEEPLLDESRAARGVQEVEIDDEERSIQGIALASHSIAETVDFSSSGHDHAISLSKWLASDPATQSPEKEWTKEPEETEKVPSGADIRGGESADPFSQVSTSDLLWDEFACLNAEFSEPGVKTLPGSAAMPHREAKDTEDEAELSQLAEQLRQDVHPHNSRHQGHGGPLSGAGEPKTETREKPQEESKRPFPESEDLLGVEQALAQTAATEHPDEAWAEQDAEVSAPLVHNSYGENTQGFDLSDFDEEVNALKERSTGTEAKAETEPQLESFLPQDSSGLDEIGEEREDPENTWELEQALHKELAGPEQMDAKNDASTEGTEGIPAYERDWQPEFGAAVNTPMASYSMAEAAEQALREKEERDTRREEERAQRMLIPLVRKSWQNYQVTMSQLVDYDPEAEQRNAEIDEDTRQAGGSLLQTLRKFNIEAEITHILKGPSITEYGILPAPGIRLNRVENLADNLAMELAARSIRIVAPIPGKKAVGIEIPNRRRSTVSFPALMDSEAMRRARHEMQLPIVLGNEINGAVQIADLRRMPHLLIAGATGSGKSVCVNVIISSLILSRTPRQLRLLMIDPKIVELKQYNDIPHLLTPVIIDAQRALQALRWVSSEMERRYALLDGIGAGNKGIESYNRYIQEKNLATMPLEFIVVIVDEFADLMSLVGKELEGMIARLAAMSRAVGIHLVLATQRPSVDVVTGLIKANFPTRIAFMVASQTDSRTILDQKGAEQLLGQGDMLFSFPGQSLVRVQGAYLSEEEAERISNYIKTLGEPAYLDEIIFEDDEAEETHSLESGSDDLFPQAVEIALQAGEISTSFLQRKLSIGYNRAARIIDEMEARGIIGPAQGSKKREVLHAL